jgi:predicted dehydrogenase
MKKVKVAVIGCGVIAPTHIQCYQACEGAELVAVCDIVEERARKLAEQYNVPRFTTVAAELFADPEIDAVSICTEHYTHVDLVIAALNAGKHVVCEKCLAASLPELDAMIAAVKAHPELVSSGIFQHRFTAINRELKAIVEEGLFGRLLTSRAQLYCERTNEYYLKDAWRGKWKSEGGSILINQAIHFIDQMLWISGGPAVDQKPVAMIRNLNHEGIIETDDTAAAVVPLANGALGVIEATSASFHIWHNTLSFEGTMGIVEIRDDKPLTVEFKDLEVQAAVAKRLADSAKPENLDFGKEYYGGGHPAQINDFIAAIQEKRAPYVSLEDAASTARVILEIYAPFRKV